MERTGVTNQSTIKSVALKTYGAATIIFLPGCDTTRDYIVSIYHIISTKFQVWDGICIFGSHGSSTLYKKR